jgi:Asp-tRNA(Asn)/Glu-tRNA(Gln) amidotransferase A subunit family amidase
LVLLPETNDWGGEMGRPLIELSVSEAARATAQGEITSRQLVSACLERIDARDDGVKAWEFIDKSIALEQAEECDRSARRGPLHGVPVGIKDIIQTADMPTGYGSPIYRNNRTGIDAECVKRLRAAGAVILGKTVTTEFAVYAPGKTTNPHNRLHTPGGSSSGSAAAVADCQVPFALGTQTAGSVIRPASFCGVIGYKPSYGLIPMDGVLPNSTTLDTVGIFTRKVEDLAIVAGVLAGIQFKDPAAIEVGDPRIGLFRTPWWEKAEPEERKAVEATAQALARSGASVSELTIPGFEELRDAHIKIMCREIATSRHYEYESHRSSLSARLQEIIENGRALALSELQNAIRTARRCRGQIARVFAAYDVLLTPSATGAAPEGLSFTGDPIFNGIWTLLGVPCITYPAGCSTRGLPLGVQVIGPVDEDDRLIATTKWMQENSAPSELRCD